MKKQLFKLNDLDVLKLTKTGEKELREPGTKLSPAQLEALVLIDGKSNIAQIAKRARSMAADPLRDGMSDLLGKDLVCFVTGSSDDAIDPGDFFNFELERTATTEVSEIINAEADAETEFLKRNGYCVNMARSPSGRRKYADGHKLKIFIIDDDPDICKVLQMYLKLEGFETYTAANRDEIVAGLRLVPLPDLVLLDVWLTDVNGFNILNKMRQHPVLKKMPVIMLTAEATREAVLKGILGGADGYITKPFQIHPLVKAVKTVLGMKHDPNDIDWDYTL